VVASSDFNLARVEASLTRTDRAIGNSQREQHNNTFDLAHSSLLS
jgi:hypothetical protein